MDRFDSFTVTFLDSKNCPYYQDMWTSEQSGQSEDQTTWESDFLSKLCFLVKINSYFVAVLVDFDIL